MRFRRLITSTVCIVMTVLLLGNLEGFYFLPAQAKSISDLRQEAKDARDNSSRLKDKINDLKSQNAPKKEKKALLEQQIAATQREIDIYNEQISNCDADIQAKEKEVTKKEKELDKNKELFKKRIVAMYMSGSNNELEVLLSADDFADFLAKTELVRSVTEHDTKLMDTIKNTITEIEKAKDKIQKTKSEKAAAKKQVAAKQSELQAQFNEVNQIVTKNEQSINDLNKLKADEDAAEAKSERDIQAAIKRAQEEAAKNNSGGGSGGSVVGTGQFTWPVPGYYGISSPYGWRWGRLHKGIDISSGGIYGKAIVAADSGRVICTSYDSGGYGNYVMIDHGSPYVTLYGHMSSCIVSYGQSVKKGQTIGYVGSTGHSTGPHLHFEIRKNGTAINPMNFF